MKVSVIIPTYNRKEYLPQAIESVLQQDMEGIEIVVLDDGSTDGTREKFSPYLNKIKWLIVEVSG